MAFSILISLASYLLLVLIVTNEKLLIKWEDAGGDVGLLIFCAGFAPFPFLNIFVLLFLIAIYSKYR